MVLLTRSALRRPMRAAVRRFPFDGRDEADGTTNAIFLRFDTLPGVGTGPYSAGDTLVHEVRHT